MKPRRPAAACTAIAMISTAFLGYADQQSPSFTTIAASEAYIEQSRGHVAPGSSIQTKPPPEIGTPAGSPSAATPPTAPETCNAQNAASSQACYTATQQGRSPAR